VGSERDHRLVSVVTVNYFSEELAARCVRSVLQAEPLASEDIEFAIVDNGSSLAWEPLLEGVPKICLIRCAENTGFARAANRGIRATRGDYIFLINPDSLVCEGAVSRAVAFLEDPANQTVAILGPKVYDDTQKGSVQLSVRSFPGFAQALFGRYSLLTRLWPTNPWSSRYLKSDWHHSAPGRVDWVSGCCMLLRRKALEEIGLFDEAYFMYIEDVDLCRRAWARGWEVAYFPAAEVIHQIGASSRHRPISMIVQHHRSMWIYYRKYFRDSIVIRAAVLLGIGTRAVVRIVPTLIGLCARRLVGSCGH